jgi:hypothetical protein
LLSNVYTCALRAELLYTIIAVVQVVLLPYGVALDCGTGAMIGALLVGAIVAGAVVDGTVGARSVGVALAWIDADGLVVMDGTDDAVGAVVAADGVALGTGTVVLD